MGLFCFPQGEQSGDLVRSAIGNLEIFLQHWKHEYTIRCSSNYPNDNLIQLAIGQLNDALVEYHKECDVNLNINPPLPPESPVDLELALESAKGDTSNDCSKMLRFMRTHSHEEIDELFLCLMQQGASVLGYTAALRFTWMARDKLKRWYSLRDVTYNALVTGGYNPKEELTGLLDLEPEL